MKCGWFSFRARIHITIAEVQNDENVEIIKYTQYILSNYNGCSCQQAAKYYKSMNWPINVFSLTRHLCTLDIEIVKRAVHKRRHKVVDLLCGTHSLPLSNFLA